MKIIPRDEHRASEPTPVSGPAIQATPPPATPTSPEKDARYMDVAADVPSTMAFYPFDALHVRPYNVQEIVKLGAASRSGKLRYVVDAVGSAIDQPIGNILLMDFTYLCFWLRTQSFKKSPFTLTWLCNDADHRSWVANGMDEHGAELPPPPPMPEGVEAYKERPRVAPKASLKNNVLLTETTLLMTKLDTDTLKEPAEFLHARGIFIMPVTVATFLEATTFKENELSDEDAYLIPLASILAASVHGKGLKDRTAALKTLLDGPDGVVILETLNVAKDIIDKAGVHEVIVSQCQYCGKEQELTPNVDFLSFFPY